MGLWWGAGGGGGAAWTPGQLQYDVDVRVVVHRRGAAAARVFFRLDLTLMTKIARGLLDVGQTLDQNETQPWVTRTSNLLVFGPLDAAKTRIKIEM